MAFDDQYQQVDLDTWEKRVFEKHGVPEGLRMSIRNQESGGDVNATSPTGVKGRYQVTQKTAANFGLNRDDPWEQPVAAARLLRQGYDDAKRKNPKFSDRQAWLASSASYYAGPDAFDADGNLGTGSKDGLSNPSRYAESIAQKWADFERGSQSAQPALQPEPSTLRKIIAPDRQKTMVRGPVIANQPSPFGLKSPTGFEQTAQQVSALTSQISPEVVAQASRRPVRGGLQRATEAVLSVAQPSLTPLPRPVREAVNQLRRSAMTGTVGIAQGAANLVDLVDRQIGTRVGIDPTSELRLAERLKPYTDQVRAGIEARTPIDPNNQGWITAKIPSAVGSLIPFVAGSAMGMGVKGAALVGAAMNTDEIVREMDEAGVDPVKRDRSIAMAGATGLTEAIGVGRALDKFGLKRAFMRRIVDIAEESGQEAAQSYLNNVNASIVGGYDPNRPASRGVVEAAVLGAIVGGGVQGAGAMGTRHPAAPKARVTLQSPIDIPVYDDAGDISGYDRVDAPLTPDVVGQGANRAGDLGATVQRAGDIRPRPRGTAPMPIQNRLASLTPTPDAPATTAMPPLDPTQIPAQPASNPLAILQENANEAKINAAQFEQAGDWESAQREYDVAHKTLVEAQRQMRRGRNQTPEQADALSAIAREISGAALNRNRASRSATVARREQGIAGRQARKAQDAVENAPTADLPAETNPLLKSVNPESGIPAAEESPSGLFGQLARRQAVEQAKPQRGPKGSGQLSAVEYLKRASNGEGIRVSDRGEARVLGAKEAGIVGLTNRASKYAVSDAQVMLDEGGFSLQDGRRFTDPSVTENDVLAFLAESGREGRMNTRDLDQRIEREAAEYYENQPTGEVRPASNRLPRIGDLPPSRVAGLRPERPEIPRETSRPLTVAEQARQAGGSTDDLAILDRLNQRLAVEEPRPYGERTRHGEPGSGGRSLSPYADLTENNRGALDQLEKMNLESPEAGEILARIDDYVERKGIDPIHLVRKLNSIRSNQVGEARRADEGVGSGPLRQTPSGELRDFFSRPDEAPPKSEPLRPVRPTDAEPISRQESAAVEPEPQPSARGNVASNVADTIAEDLRRLHAMNPEELDQSLRQAEARRNEDIRNPRMNEVERRMNRDLLKFANERRHEMVRAKQLPAKSPRGPARGERPTAKGAASIKNPLEQDVTILSDEDLAKRIRDAERILNAPELSRDRRRKVDGFLNRAKQEQGKRTPEASPETPRTVSHPDPAIDGQLVLATTADGRVIVANEGNKSGVSVVKDRLTTEPKPDRVQQSRTVRVGDDSIDLTSEQSARWEKEVDEPLRLAKERYDYDIALARKAPDRVYAARLKDQAEKDHKAAGMQIASIKRQIAGKMTPKESAEAARREASNYSGKDVSVRGVNGKVAGTAFGKVKVKLEDGKTVTVDRDQIAPPVKYAIPEEAMPELNPAMARRGYFNTPSVERAPQTPEEGLAIVGNVRSEFRHRRGAPGTLHTNEQGTIVIASAAHQAGIPIASAIQFEGARFRNDDALAIADVLESKASGYGKEGESLRQIAIGLREAVDDAKANGSNGIVVADSSQGTLTARKQLLREERFHQYQGVEGLFKRENAEAIERGLRDDPAYQVIRAKLIAPRSEGGYEYSDDPTILITEASAKVASGQWEEYGLKSEVEAIDFLERYFEAGTKVVGPQLVAKIAPGTAAAQRGQRNVRQRIGSESGIRGRERGAEPGVALASVGGGRPGGDGRGIPSPQSQTAALRAITPESLRAGQPVESTPTQNPRRQGLAGIRAEDLRAVPQRSGAPPPEPKSRFAKGMEFLGELYHAPKSLLSSADISAPGRQGFFLQPLPIATQVGRRGLKRQFQSLVSTPAYDRFVGELRGHRDYQTAKDSGLYLATAETSTGINGREEGFASRLIGKLPHVKYSEQAYKTYLDSIRMDTFEKYSRLIDRQRGTLEQKSKAKKAAADWINNSSGRGKVHGNLGEAIEGATPLLNTIFFAPRYTVSRFQMMNPATYVRNLQSPQHRVVFRQQASEMFQAAGVLVATGALAHAAGADISFDPEEADFLKLKFGNTRYDVLAGTQQVARLALRIGDWMKEEATGKSDRALSAKRGGAAEAVKRFGRTKLAPVPSFFVDWWSDWKNVGGEKHKPGDFSVKNPIVQRALPLMWSDVLEGFERGYRQGGVAQSAKEGVKTAARFAPASVGIGVQEYGEKGR